MTINFYLDSKIIDGNKKAIYCYIRGIENKKKTIIPTNIKINPEHWNKDKQEVRKSENLYSQMNNHLVKMKDKINQLYFEEIANNPVISKSEFDKIIKKELINKKEEIKQIEIIPSKPSLSQYYKEYLISKAPVLANNSMKNYTILKNHLLNYEKIFKVKLTFEDMNFEFFDKFRNYFIEELELTNNWIRKLFKMLNTFLNWAYDRNYHQNLTFKKFNLKEEDIAVTILMPQELEQLISLDLSNNERLEKVRDIFVFQCYTGQRYSDIQKLDFSDIKKGIWYLKTQKTKDDLNIPIFGQALKVYNKYKEKYSKLPTISNQNANDYIKEICKLAGIDTPYKKINYVGSKIIEKKEPKYNFITTHIARKTFISLSIHNKMLPDTIMKITGHKKYEVFKKYEKLMDSFVNSEMERVWGE